jgi:predicted DNA-binding transcriptional regulator AlpA
MNSEVDMSVVMLTEAEREYAAKLARDLPAVIDLDDLPRWIGMSRATIYRLRQRNRFPIRPIHPTTRRVQFAGIDVLRYLLRSKD